MNQLRWFECIGAVCAFLCLLVAACSSWQKGTVHEGIIPSEGFGLYYRTIGSGDPIVMLHGGPGLEFTYLMRGMEWLARRHTMIFFDQRFIGRSTGVFDSCKVTFDAFVDDVERVRNHLGLGKIHLLGHSFGGLTAMVYAIRNPEAVQTLVLLNSPGADTEWQRPFNENRSRRCAKEDGIALDTIQKTEAYKNRVPESIKRHLTIFFKPYFFNPDFAGRLVLDIRECTAENSGRVRRCIWQCLGNYNFFDQLSRISCPTLIVNGDADPLPLESMEKVHRAIPQSKLVVLEKCGHFPYIECPDQFFDVLDKFYQTSNQ